MDKQSNAEEMEIVVSNFLRFGVYLSAVIVFIGLAVFLITGNSGYKPNYYPKSPIEILKGFVALKSYAIMLTGLLILIITPVMRVGISIIVFFKEKDYLYVKITAAVFIILIVSFVLGKVE